MNERALFRQVAEYAGDFVETLETRPVRPEAGVAELAVALGGPLPEEPLDPQAVLAALVEAAAPGLVATPSGRYFGFVIGGGVPAAVAADMLASVWDQNAGLYAGGPAASVSRATAARSRSVISRAAPISARGRMIANSSPP